MHTTRAKLSQTGKYDRLIDKIMDFLKQMHDKSLPARTVTEQVEIQGINLALRVLLEQNDASTALKTQLVAFLVENPGSNARTLVFQYLQRIYHTELKGTLDLLTFCKVRIEIEPTERPDRVEIWVEEKLHQTIGPFSTRTCLELNTESMFKTTTNDSESKGSGESKGADEAPDYRTITQAARYCLRQIRTEYQCFAQINISSSEAYQDTVYVIPKKHNTEPESITPKKSQPSYQTVMKYVYNKRVISMGLRYFKQNNNPYD